MSNPMNDPRNNGIDPAYTNRTRSSSSLWILGAALAAILIIVGLLGMRNTDTATTTADRSISSTSAPSPAPRNVPAAPATPAPNTPAPNTPAPGNPPAPR
jgi:hypothetical protein